MKTAQRERGNRDDEERYAEPGVLAPHELVPLRATIAIPAVASQIVQYAPNAATRADQPTLPMNNAMK